MKHDNIQPGRLVQHEIGPLLAPNLFEKPVQLRAWLIDSSEAADGRRIKQAPIAAVNAQGVNLVWLQPRAVLPRPQRNLPGRHRLVRDGQLRRSTNSGTGSGPSSKPRANESMTGYRPGGTVTVNGAT